jgi:hypothetical protein
MRRRVEKLGDLYRELEASVYDAHAIATGVVRLASADEPAPPEAVAAIEAAAGAVKAIEPAEARHSALAAHEAARRLRDADSSLGAAVIAHGVVGVADHTQRAAEAREEERKLGESRKRRSPFR